MQAVSVTLPNSAYNSDMQTGRPPKRQRSPLGERIASLREQAGLSQQQLAEKTGANQQTIAYWERRAATLRPDQLTALAAALNTSVDHLLGQPPRKMPAAAGPAGKMRQVFEDVSKLPRRQQQQIAKVVSALLAQAKTA
jgi:hypothetical protein